MVIFDEPDNTYIQCHTGETLNFTIPVKNRCVMYIHLFNKCLQSTATRWHTPVTNIITACANSFATTNNFTLVLSTHNRRKRDNLKSHKVNTQGTLDYSL